MSKKKIESIFLKKKLTKFMDTIRYNDLDGVWPKL